MCLDSWAETGCSGKHDYTDELVQGKSVNVTGFTYALISIDNLPISHVLYAFYKEDGTVVLLEHNNTIHTGKGDIINSLANPIQCEDNDMKINFFPKVYYPDTDNAQ